MLWASLCCLQLGIRSDASPTVFTVTRARRESSALQPDTRAALRQNNVPALPGTARHLHYVHILKVSLQPHPPAAAGDNALINVTRTPGGMSVNVSFKRSKEQKRTSPQFLRASVTFIVRVMYRFSHTRARDLKPPSRPQAVDVVEMGGRLERCRCVDGGDNGGGRCFKLSRCAQKTHTNPNKSNEEQFRL